VRGHYRVRILLEEVESDDGISVFESQWRDEYVPKAPNLSLPDQMMEYVYTDLLRRFPNVKFAVVVETTTTKRRVNENFVIYRKSNDKPNWL